MRIASALENRRAALTLGNATSLARAIAAGGRCLDDDGFAGPQHGRVAALQPFDPAILPPYRVLTGLARFPPGKPERPHAPMPRQDRAFHLFQKADGSAHPIAG